MRGIGHLQTELARVESLGGEGLMLRQPGSQYEPGRSNTLLKIKTFHDAEGRVVEHLPGKGRHTGRLGAVVVELPNGLTFSVARGSPTPSVTTRPVGQHRHVSLPRADRSRRAPVPVVRAGPGRCRDAGAGLKRPPCGCLKDAGNPRKFIHPFFHPTNRSVPYEALLRVRWRFVRQVL